MNISKFMMVASRRVATLLNEFKKVIILQKIIVSCGLLLCFSYGFASSKIINLYTWTGYFPQSVLNEFTKETGITVHVSTFDSNEILYAKLKADPRIGYDVIVPSSYYVQRMRNQGMLHPVNKTKITNFHYLKACLLNQIYDPGNTYSIPFVWGTTGIIVNKKFWNVASIQRWSDLWQPRFANQLLLLDDPREAFAIALLKLGYSINSTNPEQIKAAFHELQKLMKNIKVFNADAMTNIYIDGDVTIGMNWSGESFLAAQENANLVYVYPKDGFSIWIDCMAIPKYAPDYANALQFINFVLRPDIAKQMIIADGYALANAGAMKLLPEQYRNNPIFNPSDDIVKRGTVQLDVGDALALYQKYWQLLKLGSDG